jgi:CRISP-associated protein Cas1
VREIRDHELVQVAAYRHCLEKMGKSVSGQSVWFTEHRRRVMITAEDLSVFDVPALVSEVRSCLDSDTSPPVLVDDQRCRSCSQVSVCQPSDALASDPRIVAPHPDGQVLCLDDTVTSVRLERGGVRIDIKDANTTRIPLERISGAVLFGNVPVTTAVIRTLVARGAPVVLCTYSGIVEGYAASVTAPNGSARSRIATLDPDTRYRIAAEMIRAKVSNQAALIGRYGNRKAANTIRSIRDSIPETTSTGGDVRSRLLGIEGPMKSAAREGCGAISRAHCRHVKPFQ